MSVISDKISSDSRSFLAGVKSSTAKNDRSLNFAVNLGMRLDQKEVELSQKRRKINAESFEEQPQQIQDNFNDGYISGYQFGIADGFAEGVKVGRDGILNPLDKIFKSLPVAAVAILAGIPQLTNVLDVFLPNRDKSEDSDDGGVSPTSAADQSGGLGSSDTPPSTPQSQQPTSIPIKVEPFDTKSQDQTPAPTQDSTPLEEQATQTDESIKPVIKTFNPENMGREDSNTQLLVVRQPIIVTKKEIKTVVNNGSQLAVILDGDQRQSDVINYARSIT
tara:strand:- start:27 stop:857 length:831 start_codon:yes stop_codon:yes gene_type:complete